MSAVTLLSYAGCSTCAKALAWLRMRGVEVHVRAIVDVPPTRGELATWVPLSGRTLRQWLNIGGLSCRALGKERVAAASDADLVAMLCGDGKLVRRPVLVGRQQVMVGFERKAYEQAFPRT